MSLTDKQRNALYDAIVKLFTPDDLEILVRRCGKHVYEVSGPGPLPKQVMDVIVAAEHEGWIVLFARAAAKERPKSVSLPNLAEEIAVMTGESIAQELIDYLMQIVTPDRVPLDCVLDGYTYFVSTNVAYDIHVQGLADAHAAVVTQLGHGAKGDERHPLLRFAAYLAQQKTITEATRARLETWIKSALDAWELPPRKVRAHLDSAIAATVLEWATADLHLLVSVSRRAGVLPGKREPPYEVSSWRHLTAPDGSAIGFGVRVGEQRACDAESMIGVVIDDIVRMFRARRLTRSFAVELFVPLDLMALTIDQSPFELPEEETSPLGSRFRLYLRSWERVYEPALDNVRTEWRAQWAEATSKGWKGWKADRQVFNSSAFAKQMRAQKASRVALTFAAVQPQDYIRPDGAIWQIITSGTPVALWPRSETPDYEAVLDSLVAHDAGDWRDAVLDSRAAAAAAEEHCGSHLVLLWDDPRRLPPNDPSNAQFMEME